MPRIRMFVKGQGEDHEIRSPKMPAMMLTSSLARLRRPSVLQTFCSSRGSESRGRTLWSRIA